MSKKKQQVVGFEEAMTELEALVDSMETDPLSLEESLKKFEKGVQLTHICQQALSKVEQEIKILTSTGDEENFSATSHPCVLDSGQDG